MTTFQEVADYIASADRNDIDSIFTLCRSRAKLLGQVTSLANMADIKPGDKVRITAPISPKYLIGATGTVGIQSASRAGSLSVTLDRQVGKFSNISPIGVPAACLAKI